MFETAGNVFAIPMELNKVWSPVRFFSWYRATLTSWLHALTQNHMKKHQRKYLPFLTEIGPEAFKRPLLTHRNGITTGWKRAGKVSRDNTKAREYLAREYGGRSSEKCKLEPTSLVLFKQRTPGEETTEFFKKIAGTEKVDASLRGNEGMGRKRDKFP